MAGGFTSSRGDGADDGCPGVAPQAGLQHPSQLAVPEGHMASALQHHRNHDLAVALLVST